MRKLESIRVDLGMDQREMAKALGIGYSTYQRKERGENPLLARELMAISKMSGIAAEDIEIPC